MLRRKLRQLAAVLISDRFNWLPVWVARQQATYNSLKFLVSRRFHNLRKKIKSMYSIFIKFLGNYYNKVMRSVTEYLRKYKNITLLAITTFFKPYFVELSIYVFRAKKYTNYFFSKTIYYYLRNEEKSFYKSQLAYINWLKKRFFFASRRDNLYRSLHITLDAWSEFLGYIILFFFFFFCVFFFFFSDNCHN